MRRYTKPLLLINDHSLSRRLKTLKGVHIHSWRAFKNNGFMWRLSGKFDIKSGKSQGIQNLEFRTTLSVATLADDGVAWAKSAMYVLQIRPMLKN